MNQLEQYRTEIEQVDDELIKLLIKRMELSKKIGEYKKSNGLSVYDPKREEELKNKNLLKVEEIYKSGYSEIFETILKVSKDFQL
ncbi:MAG: chorismate mutase [Bacilli bacterium]|nr:chorismate mutase [Bacilli bacterium]